MAKIKYISIIIFWGALWGLEEATLGHLLHLASFNIGWFIWFPFAYFFMSMVYRQTGNIGSVCSSALIAASVKFTDIFITTRFDIVFCPALSILLEGVSLASVLLLYNRLKIRREGNEFIEIMSASILWRSLYLMGMLLVSSYSGYLYPYDGLFRIFYFIFFEGLINLAFTFAVMSIIKKRDKIKLRVGFLKPISKQPLISIILLGLAVAAQWIW